MAHNPIDIHRKQLKLTLMERRPFNWIGGIHFYITIFVTVFLHAILQRFVVLIIYSHVVAGLF